MSLEIRLPATTQMIAATTALMTSAIFSLGLVNRFTVNQPKSSRQPRAKDTRVLDGLASNSTKIAWMTITAAMTEQTTRTIVAMSSKTRAEPLLAITGIVAQPPGWRDLPRDQPSSHSTASARWSDSGRWTA